MSIDKDIEYAQTWCKNGKLIMLGERIDRIAEQHAKIVEAVMVEWHKPDGHFYSRMEALRTALDNE